MAVDVVGKAFPNIGTSRTHDADVDSQLVGDLPDTDTERIGGRGESGLPPPQGSFDLSIYPGQGDSPVVGGQRCRQLQQVPKTVRTDRVGYRNEDMVASRGVDRVPGQLDQTAGGTEPQGIEKGALV